MRRNGDDPYRRPGPSTFEKKDWLSTIKKGVALTIIIWIGLCSLWFVISVGAWLIDPYAPIVYWFRERPRIWGAVNVLLGIPCLIGMIAWARQELLDEDWTSLQGHHGLSGIVPMTPIVRLILFVKWLQGDGPRPERQSRVSKLYDFWFGDEDDDE